MAAGGEAYTHPRHPSHDLLTEIWRRPPGFWGWIRGVNHRTVGLRYIVTAAVFFLVGGIEALVMRLQLARPENDLLALQAYNELFTMHGTTMMFLFVVPMIEGIAMYFLPLMIGARDLPFPRLNSFGYYCFLIGGVFVYVSFAFGTVPDGGWFAYPPLTSRAFSPDLAMDFWLLGVTFVEISAIAAAIEIVVGLMKFRAPGMTLFRMPLFAWNVLIVAFMILLAFPALILASVMLEFDRAFGTQFYNPGGGGDSVLWQHLFWFFGHPEVYIQFLPAAGIISMVIPAFVRRPVVSYFALVISAITIGFLSFGLWAHHMYTTGALSILAASFIAASGVMIAIPNGIQIFTWIGTVWSGRPSLQAPLLYALGFIVLFVLGGVTGVMVALPAFDRQVHDTFFVVAHFHYVLIGGVVFPLLAGFHYWFPKVTGRMLSHRLGVASFWTALIGFNVTFFPMHIVGLIGMPRRIGIYDAGLGWDSYNLVATIGAFVFAAGVLLFIINVQRALRSGPAAGSDPWKANTLEWATASPPYQYNFAVIPHVEARDPLWDHPETIFTHERGEDLDSGDLGSENRDPQRLDPQHAPLAVQLAEPHEHRREALVTTLLDAKPEYAVVLPGPTIVPFLLSLAAGLIFLGFITTYWITFAGAGLSAVLIMIWMWPEGAEGAHERPRTPARHEGARSTSWWATFMLLFLSTALLVPLVFAYINIWSVNEIWPPRAFETPGLLMPLVLTALIWASALAAWLGNRGTHDQGGRRMRIGFVAAIATGVTFLGLQAYELSQFEVSWTEHAYSSLYFLAMGFHYLGMLLAVGMGIWTLVRDYRGHFRLGHRNTADTAFMVWVYTAIVWTVVVALAYLLPYAGSTPPEFKL